MMMFDDDDDEEEFSFEDFSEGGEESAEPPAPEPLGDEELPLENAELAPQLNGDTWTCSCGQENVGEFCVACGKPKSEATPQPNGDTWTCSCGQENVGEFCVACGKPKNPSGNFQAEHSHAHRNSLSIPRPNLQPQPPLQSLTQSPPMNQTPPPPADSSMPPQSSSGSNKALIIGAIVGALLLAGGGFFAWQNSQDDNCTLGSASSSTDNKPSENTTVIATYYVVNCNPSVTLRRMPSTESVELAQVPLGQAVGFIEETGNGFCKVNHAGKVGYILSQYLSAEKPAPVTNPPVQNAQPVNNNNSALSLGGLNLGDSADKMHQVLGREDRITPSDNPNHRHAEYRNIVITLNGNYIDGLVSYSSAVQTEKGIREGASLQAVISAYGRRCSVQTYEDLTLYEYPYDTPQGFSAMFFSLNGRIDRMTYFKRTLIINGTGFVLITLISIMFVTPFGIVTPTGNNLINIVALAMLIPKFFLDVRRLKDIGALPFSTLNSEKQTLITAGVYALWSMSFIFMSSGRRYSDFLIPFIGTLIIWGWMQFKRGTVGPN